jgi:hypothetical protein
MKTKKLAFKKIPLPKFKKLVLFLLFPLIRRKSKDSEVFLWRKENFETPELEGERAPFQNKLAGGENYKKTVFGGPNKCFPNQLYGV